ncbi:MAG: general secretion pathway protein GspA [Candidatus Rokuibacteriota bacterium]|nr:MAG: general secretion pathway protein GspA [Candidatus Rokubacteria bacterium]
MYAAYFGLTERPFSLAPDPRYLYLSDAHREALAHLLYGIGEGGSFVQLTGEVGTGKTTVCRALLEQLPPDVDVAMIFNPRLTSVELLAAVCDELRVQYPPGTTSLKVLVDALSQALLDAHARGRRTVLIIDEAQNLRARVLEEVRLLTNLETTTQKLLQVVLIGQPELADLLSRRNLRQLSQRVTARYHLRSFSEAESQRYVQHRMEVAGQRQPIFTRQAVRAAHRLSRGIPRLLNTICDRALLGAYATGQTRVKEAVVRRAAREVLGPRRSRRWVAATAAAVLLVLVGSTIALVATGGLRSLGAWALSRAEKPPDPPASAPTMDERRAPEPTLAAILDDPNLTADRASAFVNLYALWGLDARSVNADRGCELGRAAGLRCLIRTGTWTVLRRLNLPAILELATGDGRKYHVVLASLDGERATIEIGPRRVTLPSSEVERFWDGPFVLIWRSPVTGPVPLQPGMLGRDVAWLRQRLGALDGQPVTAKVNQTYDEELKRRVASFQQGEALVPDGIAGEETLVRLVATTPGANGPSLNRERP